MNRNSIYLYFQIGIRKSSNTAHAIDAAMITVRNLFAHWIKEIEVRRLSDDHQIVLN